MCTVVQGIWRAIITLKHTILLRHESACSLRRCSLCLWVLCFSRPWKHFLLIVKVIYTNILILSFTWHSFVIRYSPAIPYYTQQKLVPIVFDRTLSKPHLISHVKNTNMYCISEFILFTAYTIPYIKYVRMACGYVCTYNIILYIYIPVSQMKASEDTLLPLLKKLIYYWVLPFPMYMTFKMLQFLFQSPLFIPFEGEILQQLMIVMSICSI